MMKTTLVVVMRLMIKMDAGNYDVDDMNESCGLLMKGMLAEIAAVVFKIELLSENDLTIVVAKVVVPVAIVTVNVV